MWGTSRGFAELKRILLTKMVLIRGFISTPTNSISMEREPWTRRHFLYGMFTGTCLGAIFATVFYTFTEDQIYVMLIPLGFLIGFGIGAVRTLIDSGGDAENE
jgi:hypothetical protein